MAAGLLPITMNHLTNELYNSLTNNKLTNYHLTNYHLTNYNNLCKTNPIFASHGPKTAIHQKNKPNQTQSNPISNFGTLIKIWRQKFERRAD